MEIHETYIRMCEQSKYIQDYFWDNHGNLRPSTIWIDDSSGSQGLFVVIDISNIAGTILDLDPGSVRYAVFSVRDTKGVPLTYRIDPQNTFWVPNSGQLLDLFLKQVGYNNPGTLLDDISYVTQLIQPLRPDIESFPPLEVTFLEYVMWVRRGCIWEEGEWKLWTRL